MLHFFNAFLKDGIYLQCFSTRLWKVEGRILSFSKITNQAFSHSYFSQNVEGKNKFLLWLSGFLKHSVARI